MFPRMRGHEACSEAGLPFCDGGVADSGNQDSALLECCRDFKGAGFVADDNGNDGRCGGRYLEAGAAQCIAEVLDVVLERLHALGMGVDVLEVRVCGGGHGGRHCSREDETAGLVLEEFDEFLRTRHEAAFGGDGFAQRADGNVGVSTAVVLGETPAGSADHARGVRFVNHK